MPTKRFMFKRPLLAALLVLVLVPFWFAPGVALAAHQFIWWDTIGNVTYGRFGPGSPIIIRQGQMEFVNLCEIDGINDYLWPATDVYIMPAGEIEVGTELEDANGVPNTIVSPTSFGMFIDESIGNADSLSAGQYAVVFDECQDGDVDPGDFVLNPAFEVTGSPTEVPFLPTFSDLKQKAAEKASEKLESLGEKIDDWFQSKGKLPNTPLGKFLQGRTDIPFTNNPTVIVRIQLINQAKHYLGIAADPPDPAFSQVTPLTPTTTIATPTDDPALLAAANVGNEASSEAALAKALLHALERYQGAELEGNGEWALIHARAIRDYAQQLQAQVADDTAALQALDAALLADTTDVDGNAALAQTFVQRVRASGFTAEEIAEARNLGMSDADIAARASEIANYDYTGFSEASLRATIASIISTNQGLHSALGNLASAIGTNITQLEADPRTPDNTPVAKAGGPYSGTEGVSVQLNGTATSPTRITSYAWDTDGDGAFDDATGAKPAVSFTSPYRGLIGLRVTNASGLSNVAYTHIAIAEANRRPLLTNLSPLAEPVEIDAGLSQLFSVAASDPDGDATSTKWFVDGTAVGTGASFTYSPALAQVGAHRIEAEVSDNQPLGGAVRKGWTVVVRATDGDGDGYRANKDCDDADPAVNPAQTEIIGNGKDDDCNAKTTDIGGPPVVSFNPEGTGRNVALLEAGASMHSVSNEANTSNTVKAMLDYAATDSGWRTASGKNTNQWTIVTLVGGKTYQLDRVRLMPGTGNEGVKDFTVAVSNNTATGPFTTVLTATAPLNGALAEYRLAEPVQAKYVKLTALNNQNSSATSLAVKQFKVYTSQEGERTVTFKNLTVDSDNDIVSYAWDFGDGTTSSDKQPSHTYPAVSKTYNVSLKVTDRGNNVVTSTLPYRVLLPPAANFTVAPTTPNEGASGSYTDASTDPDGEGMIALRTWYWPGNSSSTLTAATSTRTFFNSGPIVVKLQVVDRQEQVSTIEKTVTIANVPPTVTPVPAQTLVWGQNIDMTALIMNDISDTDRSALTCEWNFGDGQTARVDRCTSSTGGLKHSYANPGSYTATLKVSDPDGGSTTVTTPITVQKRNSFVQVLKLRNLADGQLEITAKLLDQYTWATLPGWNVAFKIGTATANAQTSAAGTATVTLPRAASADTVGVSVQATSHYNPSGMEPPIEAPRGDIVFVVDESGSMGDDQADLQRNLSSMVMQLAAKVDFQIGVVGFGAATGTHGITINGQGVILAPFNNDVGTISQRIGDLKANGGFEAGFDGTRVAMSDAMGFRSNAGTCAVLISDDQADVGDRLPTTREQAVAALKARNAVFLGVVHPGITNVKDHYGMNPGSLGAETGGQTWHINDFRTNPQPVLDAIMAKCVTHITRIDLGLAVSDGQATARAGDSLTYTLTVTNNSTGLARNIALADTLPTGTSFVQASGGGTFSNGKVTWPAFDLAAGQTATRTLTVKLGALAVGTQLTNSATVADDGQSGPDRTPADNTASDTTTVERALNSAPVAQDQAVTTDEDTAKAITLAASDADGNPISYTIVAAPQHGTLSGTAPNVTYTPAANYAGSDSFSFTVNDGSVDSNAATVSITVNAVNDGPTVATDGPYTVAEGGAVIVDATGSDPEGGALSYAWDFDGDGVFETAGQHPTFSADALNGPDTRTITVQVSDGAATATAQTTVAVTNVAPRAELSNNGPASEGSAVAITFSNVYDPSASDQASLRYAVACDGGSLDGVTYASATAGTETICTFDDGPAAKTVRARVFDADGGVNEYTTTVELTNVAPTATLFFPDTVDEDAQFTLELRDASDVSQADVAAGLQFSFDCGSGTWSPWGSQPSVVCNATGSGALTIRGRVQDKDNGSTERSATITANSLPPTVGSPVVEPEPSDEGQAATARVTFTPRGANNGPYTCSFDYGDGSAVMAGTVQNSTCVAPAHTYADNGVFTVTATVASARGAVASSAVTHVVSNVAPLVAAITIPAAPTAINSAVAVQASFSDPGVIDTHTASWNWGDGSSTAGTLASGAVSGSHVYNQAGVYQVTLTVTDKDNGVGQAVSNYVVVYDANGGFVTGGGWIESPAGAYLADQTAAGRANFGFNAKYKQGTVPSGQTEFQLKAGNMNFHSASYEWLVVNGARAQYKGTGTINGQSGYSFMVTVIDDRAGDTLRMKIWHQASDTLIYDTQLGAPDNATPTLKLNGGSIVVHR